MGISPKKNRKSIAALARQRAALCEGATFKEGEGACARLGGCSYEGNCASAWADVPPGRRSYAKKGHPERRFEIIA